jgi:3-hydroxybutyrate dehydrogenase
MGLKRKTALITGSTSGIGLGMAKGLAAEGANIVINGLGKPEDIEKARKEVEALGVKCVYIAADMTKADEIVAMVAQAEKQFGAIDVLVNNAGIQHVSPIESFPPEKWDAIIAIILSSSFHTIRSALPKMKEQGWGRIINLASAHALVASPYKSAYVAAKHGLAGLTKAVALETAQNNITVNAICPGYVKTPLVDNQIADTAKARGMTENEVVKNVLLAAQWTKKFITIDDVAKFAVFLCSDAAQNITGSVLSIDGGWTAA